jgi:hypothetical protein
MTAPAMTSAMMAAKMASDLTNGATGALDPL